MLSAPWWLAVVLAASCAVSAGKTSCDLLTKGQEVENVKQDKNEGLKMGILSAISRVSALMCSFHNGLQFGARSM